MSAVESRTTEPALRVAHYADTAQTYGRRKFTPSITD